MSLNFVSFSCVASVAVSFHHYWMWNGLVEKRSDTGLFFECTRTVLVDSSRLFNPPGNALHSKLRVRIYRRSSSLLKLVFEVCPLITSQLPCLIRLLITTFFDCIIQRFILFTSSHFVLFSDYEGFQVNCWLPIHEKRACLTPQLNL